jgi:hypothetical protein
MDNRLEKLEELNKLNKSGHVSDEEYKTLLSEIISKSENKNFEVVDNEKVNTLKKCSQCGSDNEIENSECSVCKTDFSLFEVKETGIVKIQSIKEAGRNVIIIYYIIIVELFVSLIHNLLIDVKTKKIQNFDIYSETNVFTKHILDMKNINDIVKYIDNLNKIYYFIQLVLFISFMHCLLNIGKNLKSVE